VFYDLNTKDLKRIQDKAKLIYTNFVNSNKIDNVVPKNDFLKKT
jgi:hypothetical protein